MERKRVAALAAVNGAMSSKTTPKKGTSASKRSRPKKTPAPRGNQEITRVSPLVNPSEIDECCGVCFDGDSYEDNPILFCEKCDVAVHQTCYGIKKIPEGDWFCKACTALKRDNRVINPRPKQCCLCTVPGGALKRTSDSRWAHLFCSQWIPELFIADVDAMEPIENVAGVHKDRLKMTCAVCKTADGACVQCAYGVCSVPFHPMCALRDGVRMEVRSTEGSSDCAYNCFCEKHVKEMEKRERRAARAAAGGGPDTPGGDAAGMGEHTPKPTPPPTPKQEQQDDGDRDGDGDVKREEDTPSTTTTTKDTNAGPSTTTTTTTTTTMETKTRVVLSELTSRECRALIDAILELEEDAGSDADALCADAGVSREDFDAWRAKNSATRDDTDISKDDGDAVTVVDSAVREWLARRTTAELFKPVRDRLGGGALAFNPDADNNVDGETKAPVSSTDLGLPERVPYPIEHLAEYTRVSLDTVRAPPPPRSVKDVLVDPAGSAAQPILRLAKCQVCEIHKRGICGTSSAVMRCLRRKENLERARAERSAELAEDPDPEARIRRELNRVEGAVDIMRLAPDDEVVAEIYRCQTALARQAYVNRTLLAQLLDKVSRALPAEAEARAETERALRDTSAYEERWRGGRWRMERLRKEGKEEDMQFEGGELDGADMCDPLVESGAMEDALCCVCAGGESEFPNEIVFCERCEMCVHQQCYGVTNIPEGEWLCWPCHETERLERENGLPGTRPPRYMREAGDGAMYDPRVQCLLCPVKRGALRTVIDPRTMASPGPMSPPANANATDAPATPNSNGANAAPPTPGSAGTLPGVTPTRGGRLRWCHVVCAHWQQAVDTDLYLEGPAAVSGLDDIRGAFKNARCSACRLDDGACIPCSATNCSVVFHPLCARRCGWHMLPLQSPEPIAFCARHSVDERRAPGSTTRAKYSSNTNGARFGQRQSSKKKRTPTLDEMDMLRRARVGLETLRLLCDRVVKREKIKRLQLEQHHALWLAQIRGDASGPVYELGDDTQAHVYVPDISKERKLLFLTAQEFEAIERTRGIFGGLPDDVRLVRCDASEAERRADDDRADDADDGKENGDGNDDEIKPNNQQ